MVPLRDQLWFFLFIATVSVLRPAKSLYPRFWMRLFEQVLSGAAFISATAQPFTRGEVRKENL